MHIYRKNLLIIITLCLLLATIFTKDIGVDAKHTDNSLLVSHQKTSTKSADKEYVTPKKSEDLKLHSKGAVVMQATEIYCFQKIRIKNIIRQVAQKF